MRYLAIALLTVCSISLGLAQNTNAGDIRGTVTDSSGAIVPEVKVTIVNTQTGVRKEFSTNSAGIYDAVSILPGEYYVTFSKEGFGTLRKEGISLGIAVITLDAQLTVGAATQQVQVSAQGEFLQTEKSEQSLTLRSEVMAELPNVGQDWVAFTKALPGIAPNAQGPGHLGAISVNGTGRYQETWLSDGGDVTVPNSQISDNGVFEIIAEVNIVTATFDAQYGYGTSVFNRITKSGTNRFHGTAYEFAQNDFFNARSFFAQRVSNLRYNRYGVGVGGPIRRDKAFFYFNWDRTSSSSAGPGFFTFPNAAMRAGDFSGAGFPLIYDPTSLATVNGAAARIPFPGNKIPSNRLDPLAVNIQGYFPTPNLPGLFNNFYQQQLTTNPSPPTAFFGKLDDNISAANRLSGSVRFRSTTALNPAPTCPMDCYNTSSYALQVQATDVHTFSPTVVNEFRLAYQRTTNWVISPNMGQGYPEKLGWKYAQADMFPTATIGGPVGAASITGGIHNVTIQGALAPSDIVTMIRGRHIIKIGGEYHAYQVNSSPYPDRHSGVFGFTGIYTSRAPFTAGSGLGYADFLTGQVNSWSANNLPELGLRMKTPQMFVQDDFKIRPNLTLNLGLRYFIQTGWSEVHNRLSSFDPTLTNPATNTPGAIWWSGTAGRTPLQATTYGNFLPRLGFAWSPKSKWSVRGGFGLFSQMFGADAYANLGLGTGYGTSGSLASTDGTTPVFTLSNPNPPLNIFTPGAAQQQPQSMNGQAVTYKPYHTPIALLYEWSFGIQRELPHGIVAEASFVGNHGTNLLFQRDLNQVPANLLGPGNAQPHRPYPQYQAISALLYDGISNYDSLQAVVRKRFARGFSFDVNYTWSKNLVNQDNAGWSGQAGAQNWQNAYAPNANYGLSNNNVPRMLKGNFVYQLPIGKGKALMNRGGVLDALFGGWQSSAIFLRNSGTPFTPIMGTTNLSGALAGTWYPNRIGSGTLANPAIQHWFDTSAFTTPAAFTFGNSGRNILFGPTFSDIDFSMGKNFRLPMLGESGKLQFRVDAINVINHPSFGNPNASIGAAGAGIISSASVGGRQIQLGARLSF